MNAVGTTLNAGLSDVINMDDRLWASLTANSAPIRFENPDTLTGSLRLAAGPVALQPSQVGPYLAALNPGENELNRLNRNQVFWQAWLKQIAASTCRRRDPGRDRIGHRALRQHLEQGPRALGLIAASSPNRPSAMSIARSSTPPAQTCGRPSPQMVPYPIPRTPEHRISSAC